MTVKHILGIIATFVYLLLVGFVDPEPWQVKYLGFKPSNLLDLTPLPLSETPSPKPETILTYEEHLEKEKAAKVIAKKYRYIDLEGAMQVVTAVYENAKRYGVRPSLLLAMIATESSFNKRAKSSVGAVGYLQVMPRWHRNKIQNRNIWDTEVNIQVGAQVLRDCYKRNKNEKKALACYNGAITPEKVEEYYNAVVRNQYALKHAITKII